VVVQRPLCAERAVFAEGQAAPRSGRKVELSDVSVRNRQSCPQLRRRRVGRQRKDSRAAHRLPAELRVVVQRPLCAERAVFAEGQAAPRSGRKVELSDVSGVSVEDAHGYLSIGSVPVLVQHEQQRPS